MVYSPWGYKESDTTERLSHHGFNIFLSQMNLRNPYLTTNILKMK